MTHKRRMLAGSIILALVLVAVGFVSGGGIDDVDHPNWSGNFLVDRTGTHRAAITSSGALKVDGSGVGTGNEIANISSALHIAGILPVQVTHISGALHIAGSVHIAAQQSVQPHISGAFRAWRVASCGATASTAVATNLARRGLLVNNVGNRPAYVGYGAAGHVALTLANGFPMHAMGYTSANAIPGENHRWAILTLENYQGPLSCITATGDITEISIIEILR